MTKNIKGRKFVATAATAALVASAIVPVASAAEFSDASKIADWAKEHVEYAKTNGLLSGNADGTFNPEGNFSRAQAAQVIVNYLGLDTKNTTAQFSDVSADEWYYGVVNAAKVAGKVDGIGEGKFNPEGNLSRQDAAKLFGSLLNLDPAKADKKVLDQFNDKASIADYADEYVAIFVAAGAINGKGEGFDPTGLITRQELAKIISLAVQADKAGKLDAYKVVEKVTDVTITSVTAINSKTAEVKFKSALPAGTDFTNFDIDGGLTVTNVVLSSDRKSATVTTSAEFVRNQEYTISVYGIKDAAGEEFAEAKGEFSWEVAEGVTVKLDATTLEQNQTVGLTVKDEAGKDVKDAKVTITSFNTNLVSVTDTSTNAASPSEVKVTANSNKLAGTTDVVVVTTLPDGKVLTNTFKVTVKEAVTTVSNAGFTLVADASALDATYANTVAFKKYVTKVTDKFESETSQVLVAFGETNGNPDTKEINFAGATRVVSSNATVATVVLEETGTGDATVGQIIVTPVAPGTTTITVTMKDGSRKTFPITVKADKVQKDISVNKTAIKLSDETVDGDVQTGVNSTTFKVTTLDQYGKAFVHPEGKVTVSVNTEGLDIAGPFKTDTNEVDFAGANNKTFTVTSQKDTPVKNAKITVSYFAKATDKSPTSTKTITVNVADIDPTSKTSEIDVVTATEIDANFDLTSAASQLAFGEIYALDSKGNRIDTLSVTSATLAEKDQDNKFVTAASNVIKFVDNSAALTYLRASGTVEAIVVAGGVTKVIPVTYKNTAVVPNKATVATTPVSIKLASGVNSITIEDILFGKLNDKEVILDDATNADATLEHIIAKLKTAKNAGYLYNKPVVTITGTDGKTLATGTDVYGTAKDASLNTWNNTLVNQLNGYGVTADGYTTNTFKNGDFEVEYQITNVNDLDLISGDTVSPATNKGATFTLVITGIYAKDSVVNVEGATTLAGANKELKAKHNLLASSVQVNVSVSK